MTSPADISTDAARDGEPGEPPYGLTFAVLALAAATIAVLPSLVAPALPEIQRELHASATAVTWLLTASLLSASILTPIVGRPRRHVRQGAHARLVAGDPRHRRREFHVASGILGVGIGLAFASLANLIVEAVRPDQTGVGTGMNTVMHSGGGSVGSQIGASVIAGALVADPTWER
jgi:MFS family permease